MVAGPNGSGKTTVTEDLLSHYWMRDKIYINPDNIAEQQHGGWNDKTSVLKAAVQAEELRHKLIADKKSFAFESVFSTDEKVQFLLKAKAAGYFVRLFYVGTETPKINIHRIKLRLQKGGHTVPTDKVIKRYGRSLSKVTALITECDRCYFYDNSIEGEEPALMFRTVDGVVAKTYAKTLPLWLKSIYTPIKKSDSTLKFTNRT